MSIKKLDNLSGQEIKEMMINRVILIDEMDSTSLSKLMDYEIDMLCFGKGDISIIELCSKRLDELHGDDLVSKDKVTDIIEKVKEEHIMIVDSDESVKTRKLQVYRGVLKKMLIAAIIMISLIATSVLVSVAFDIDIFGFLSDIIKEPEGTEYNIDRFTFYHNGNSVQYETMDEFIEKENINILYPNELPSGIVVERVIMSKSENNRDSIYINTSNPDILIYIEFDVTKSTTANDNQVYISNGVEYSIFKEDLYFATAFYKSNYYSIQADSYDNLIFIIEHFKE